MEGDEEEGNDDYMTVQSVAEGGGDVKEDEDERAEVAFLSFIDKGISFGNQWGTKLHYAPITVMNHVQPNPRIISLAAEFYTAQYDTDPDSNPDAAGGVYSFALTRTTAAAYIGQHHEHAKIIENQEQTVIMFLTRDRPEPTKVHQFRNKRYLCEKIEMEIDENGIRDEKTGYFYEMI